MKFLIVCSLVAQLASAAQNVAPPQRLTMLIGSATIQADSIERPLPSPGTIHLKGTVLITRKISAEDVPVRLMIMTVRADEADYHEDTGEIEARGNVQLNYRDDPSDSKVANVRIRLEKNSSK